MRATLTLEQIIHEELASLLSEQPGSAIFKSAPSSKFNANQIAKQLYDAKGVFNDDEDVAIKAINQIRNSEQYKQVFKSFKKISNGQTLAAYLKTFLSSADLLEVAIHLYGVLSPSDYSWTIKKLVSYDDLKNAVDVAAGRASNYQNIRYGDLPGRVINQANAMLQDKNLYQSISKSVAMDLPDVGDIILRPFVSTEYYLQHNTFSSFVNAPGGLREMVYSPLGVGLTTAASLIPTPWTKIPVAILFGILAIDDIDRLSKGDADASIDLFFDSLGIAFGGTGGKLFKMLKDKFRTLFAWIKNGGILIKISQGMFKMLFSMVKTIANTPLGKFLSKGESAVAALQSMIRSGFAKSISTLKGILQKLKSSMPNPIKRWASNALDSIKQVSVNYYMEELKPMFDAMKILGRVTKEFFKAPETAILDLARRLGIKSDWVVPIAQGAKAGFVANIFFSIPDQLNWWYNWFETQMNKNQKEQYKQDIKKLIDQYDYYSFKKKPGQSITTYIKQKNEWIVSGTKIIKSDSNTNGPALFIVDTIQNGYAKITIPSVMTGFNEIEDTWVKLTDIVKVSIK
jgi:hypothetical protein